MLIVTNIINSPCKLTYGREGWYFAENGEHTHADLATHLGQTLYKLGAVSTVEPVRFVTAEDVQSDGMKVRAPSLLRTAQ